MRTIVLTLCCAALALGAGCGKEGANVQIKNKDVNIQAAGGSNTVALPDNFPKDVPMIPGGSVKTAITTNDVVSIALIASAPVEEVAKYYRDNLQSQGWKLESTALIGQVTMVSASKDQRNFGAQIVKGDDGTTVMITLRAKNG